MGQYNTRETIRESSPATNSSLPKHSEVRKQDEVDRIYDKIIVYGCIPLDRAKAMTEEITH